MMPATKTPAGTTEDQPSQHSGVGCSTTTLSVLSAPLTVQGPMPLSSARLPAACRANTNPDA